MLITKGISEGICVRLGDATDFAPKAQIAMVIASPVFLQQRYDVAICFMLAYLKGLRDYNDAFVYNKGNKNEIINIMTKYTALKDPKTWEQVDVTGLNPDGKMYIDDIKNQYEWYKSNGGIEGTVDMSKAVDTSLDDEALKILGPYKSN
jgi:NitT/TauT family transport system substrate-binding protein